MKAAIYARYSSENQSDKSIDDQVRVCKKYALEHDTTIEDGHIFLDEATSGSLVDRPGLQALESIIESNGVETVLVDDLSRLSRSNHQMLTLVLKFHYHQVRIISVADGINTDDENSKLGIQLRGLVNELYLDDLRKKTSRGLEGQKLRGYSAGERVYGYFTEPVGELKMNGKGNLRYEGKVHKIQPEEAEIVKRIFKEFSSGISMNKILAGLNIDKIPTKRKLRGGWNISTISRILKNSKYIGIWDWRRTKGVREPLTGKKKIIKRPDNETIAFYREDLIIIDAGTWDKVKKRFEEIQGTWPVSKRRKQFYPQKSFIHTNPTHLLSGLLKCQVCGGTMAMVSGKGSGYYGCYNFRRKTCTNKLMISRYRIEEIIVNKIRDKILTPDNLQEIYRRVEALVTKEINILPGQVKKKETQINQFKREAENYLTFIRLGNVSKSVCDALAEAESRITQLELEINSFQAQEKWSFKTPAKEWINHRMTGLTDTLNRNRTASARVLKHLLGQITLEPMFYEDKALKSYYFAHTNIGVLIC